MAAVHFTTIPCEPNRAQRREERLIFLGKFIPVLTSLRVFMLLCSCTVDFIFVSCTLIAPNFLSYVHVSFCHVFLFLCFLCVSYQAVYLQLIRTLISLTFYDIQYFFQRPSVWIGPFEYHIRMTCTLILYIFLRFRFRFLELVY